MGMKVNREIVDRYDSIVAKAAQTVNGIASTLDTNGVAVTELIGGEPMRYDTASKSWKVLATAQESTLGLSDLKDAINLTKVEAVVAGQSLIGLLVEGEAFNEEVIMSSGSNAAETAVIVNGFMKTGIYLV